MKKNLLNNKKRVRLGSALFLFLLTSANAVFAQTISWDGGGGDGNWATAANWSGDVLPGATNDVVIGNFSVNISSGNFLINSLNLFGDSPRPALSIASGATLNITTTVGNNDALQIGGGIIENSGTLLVTSIANRSGITLKNGSGTAVSELTNNAGATLTVNTTASTTVGQYNGACVNFSQSNATAVFTANGTVTLTPATALNHTVLLMPAGSRGSLQGAGFTIPTGSYSIFHYQGLEFTIGQAVGVSPTVNFNVAATGVNDATGVITFFTNSGSDFTNFGTINVVGATPNGFVTFHNATSPLSFVNNGTISFNGNFRGDNSAIGLNGAVGRAFNITNNNVMSFTNTANTNMSNVANNRPGLQVFGKVTLTNAGALTINAVGSAVNNFSADEFIFINNATKTVVLTSSASGALNLASSTGVATITNNGIMSSTGIGGNGIGKLGSVFTNGATGSITFNQSLQRTNSTTDPSFLNNGIATMNTGTNTGINANVVFTNNGTLRGTGAITPSTTSLAPTTSEISPGSASASIIVLSGTTNIVNGKYVAEVNGATTAGVNYDQLNAITSAADVSVGGLTIATTFNYTPADGDVVVLINTNGGTITGTPTFTPALPTGWLATTTGGQVKLMFTGVLPVKLVSFVGAKEANSNLLTWVTASETNNLGFEVQRRMSDTAWEKIGFVKAEGKPATYRFKDNSPATTSYYRLRQLDNDNTETFSGVVVVKQTLTANVSVSPNPVIDVVNISIPNDGVSALNSTTSIFDLSGRKVLSQSSNQANFTINVAGLIAGTYVISLEVSGANYTQKLVKN